MVEAVRYALVSGPLVAGATIVNVILATPDFAMDGYTLHPFTNAQIGWVWNGEAFAPPTVPLDERKATLLAQVTGERDTRIRSPFTFNGTPFDYDAESQKRITGAASLAGFAMSLGGKLPGDMLWHGGDTPFTWIAANNSLVQMDAVTTFALGQAAAAWESAHIFVARALKDAIEAAESAEGLDAIDISAGWPG